MKLLKKLSHKLISKCIFVKSRIAPKKDVLVYVGLNRGSGFNQLFHQYKKCYGFEASPNLYQDLFTKYAKYDWVYLINAAVTVENVEEVTFYVTDNDGASSSLFLLKDEWHHSREKKGLKAINLQETIKVKGILLPDFLEKNGVYEITDYVSDIEGMDLAVLETMRSFIAEKRIKTITCEVSRHKGTNRHVGCYDNSKEGFEKLLGNNYDLVAEGYMPLRDGVFEDIPESSWAMDCRWKLRNG
jgi:FkbM family methyltransferase